MVDRFNRWLKANTPDREELAKSRWMRLVGTRVLHSEYWRFTRRSVPRGIAAGLLVGIFLLIPGLQIVGSALLCIPLRGNIPLAAGMTFLSNPATTPLILGASYALGSWLGFAGDKSAMPEMTATIAEWTNWLFSAAAPAIISGLVIIAVASAAIGYALSAIFWRWWTARKWRRRAYR